MRSKLPIGTLERLWSDPSYWRSGVYSCKADPRLIVPKRIRAMGWTLNFAHHRSWLVLIALILGAIVPATLFAQIRMVGTVAWWLFLVGYIAAVSVGSWRMSSAKRFEESSRPGSGAER